MSVIPCLTSFNSDSFLSCLSGFNLEKEQEIINTLHGMQSNTDLHKNKLNVSILNNNWIITGFFFSK